MRYSGFGIQSMSSLPKPRKVFPYRFENKGRNIRLRGPLSLVKEDVEPISQPEREVESFNGMLFILGVLISALSKRSTIS